MLIHATPVNVPRRFGLCLVLVFFSQVFENNIVAVINISVRPAFFGSAVLGLLDFLLDPSSEGIVFEETAVFSS